MKLSTKQFIVALVTILGLIISGITVFDATQSWMSVVIVLFNASAFGWCLAFAVSNRMRGK